MALPKYLLQVREGQPDTIYLWTPELAQRSDMHPVTDEHAKRIMNGLQSDDEPENIDVNEHEVDEDQGDENDLLSTAGPNEDDEPEEKHQSMTTQDDILEQEIVKIRRFRKANKLEAYILEKYHLDLIPADLDEMKAQAESFMRELARHGKLFNLLK